MKMSRMNCFVVVNSGEIPDFCGTFATVEDVYEHYNRYDTFTQRIFFSRAAAQKEANHLDDKHVKEGEPCYVVCGAYCEQLHK